MVPAGTAAVRDESAGAGRGSRKVPGKLRAWSSSSRRTNRGRTASPPPPDDRLWRHPSEMGVPAARRRSGASPGSPAPAPARRAPIASMWLVAAVSAVGASLLATGLAAVVGGLASGRPAARPSPSSARWRPARRRRGGRRGRRSPTGCGRRSSSSGCERRRDGAAGSGVHLPQRRPPAHQRPRGRAAPRGAVVLAQRAGGARPGCWAPTPTPTPRWSRSTAGPSRPPSSAPPPTSGSARRPSPSARRSGLDAAARRSRSAWSAPCTARCARGSRRGVLFDMVQTDAPIAAGLVRRRPARRRRQRHRHHHRRRP